MPGAHIEGPRQDLWLISWMFHIHTCVDSNHVIPHMFFSYKHLMCDYCFINYSALLGYFHQGFDSGYLLQIFMIIMRHSSNVQIDYSFAKISDQCKFLGHKD